MLHSHPPMQECDATLPSAGYTLEAAPAFEPVSLTAHTLVYSGSEVVVAGTSRYYALLAHGLSAVQCRVLHYDAVSSLAVLQYSTL
jgi:hypothetical protein